MCLGAQSSPSKHRLALQHHTQKVLGRKGFVTVRSSRLQSVVAGKPVAVNQNSCLHDSHSQEAESSESILLLSSVPQVISLCEQCLYPLNSLSPALC